MEVFLNTGKDDLNEFDKIKAVFPLYKMQDQIKASWTKDHQAKIADTLQNSIKVKKKKKKAPQ